mmetsp:Transcript_26721/g.67157  ORF Transcript_26721/g.67157 Transcript_26721/m.67157 type:complete len:80 (-) Transcript_26721:37-276(-)
MTVWLPLYLGTIIFFVLGIIGTAIVSLFLPIAWDRQLMRVMVWTAVVCCWMLWAGVFMSQVYPIVGVSPAYTAPPPASN